MTDTATTTTTDTGEPSGDTGASSTEDPKTFTQEDVNRILKKAKLEAGDVAELKRKAAEFDRLSEAQKTELEKATEKAARDAEARAKAEADATWLPRVLRSEVKVAAAGKLADPEDALRLLDLSSFELDDEGNVDGKAVAKAIDELLEAKPYLAAGTAPARQQKRDPFDAGTRTTPPDLPLNGDPLLDTLKQKLGIPD